MEHQHIMTLSRMLLSLSMIVSVFLCTPVPIADASPGSQEATSLPRPLDAYGDSEIDTITGKLQHRIQVEPFNIVATLIFFPQ